MIEHQVSMPLSIAASGAILNPWYELPSRVIVFDPERPNLNEDQPAITIPCLVKLPNHGVRLFFRDREVVIVFTGESSASSRLVNPIRNFLTYRTFINYNLIGFPSKPIIENTFDEVDTIRFKVERILRVDQEVRLGDKIVKTFYHKGEEEWIEIAADELDRFLSVLNQALYYAVAFYLIGCDNPRYFLVEFYKAVEVIRNAFGGESSLVGSLRPYGVTRQNYKRFMQTCNDTRSAPLDIGRHAPSPSAPLYAIDIRNLHIDPRSSETLEFATSFCRQVIDGYMLFLFSRAAY